MDVGVGLAEVVVTEAGEAGEVEEGVAFGRRVLPNAAEHGAHLGRIPTGHDDVRFRQPRLVVEIGLGPAPLGINRGRQKYRQRYCDSGAFAPPHPVMRTSAHSWSPPPQPHANESTRIYPLQAAFSPSAVYPGCRSGDLQVAATGLPPN